MSAKKILEETATKLFSLMGVEAKIEVVEGEDGTLTLNLTSQEAAGLLIGKKGETLDAIQSFLSQAVKQATGEWVRILVNIGDWREKQEGYLRNLAAQAAERALATGQSQYLYNLSAAQRRIVHLELSGNKNISTESQGEGSERYLVVTPV